MYDILYVKQEAGMAHAVRINDDLVKSAKVVAAVEHRSLAGQVEYWASIGRAAEQNPDLPFSVIREIMMAKEEAKSEMVDEYVFGEGD